MLSHSLICQAVSAPTCCPRSSNLLFYSRFPSGCKREHSGDSSKSSNSSHFWVLSTHQSVKHLSCQSSSPWCFLLIQKQDTGRVLSRMCPNLKLRSWDETESCWMEFFEVLENFSHGSSFGSRGHQLQCSSARACRLGDFSVQLNARLPRALQSDLSLRCIKRLFPLPFCLVVSEDSEDTSRSWRWPAEASHVPKAHSLCSCNSVPGSTYPDHSLSLSFNSDCDRMLCLALRSALVISGKEPSLFAGLRLETSGALSLML